MTLKLRFADFQTITRSRTVTPTSSEIEIYPVIKELYQQARTRKTPIRLLGVALSNLGLYDGQLPLFSPEQERRNQAVDAIRAKFGFDAVRLAGGHKHS